MIDGSAEKIANAILANKTLKESLARIADDRVKDLEKELQGLREYIDVTANRTAAIETKTANISAGVHPKGHGPFTKVTGEFVVQDDDDKGAAVHIWSNRDRGEIQATTTNGKEVVVPIKIHAP